MMLTDQIALESRIKEVNYLYREGKSNISDQEYDLLIEQLQKQYPDSVLLKKGVIEKPKESRKQRLPIPMYSLNKCKTIEEIEHWLKSNNISEEEVLIITPKFDGISLVVGEESGTCWTRGDGEEGQISDKHFGNMLVKVLGEDLYSFGEAIMSKEKFNQYKDKYANARNMVAGLFNRDEPTEDLKDVDYMRYGSSVNFLDKNTQLEALNELNSIPVRFELIPIFKFLRLLQPDDFLNKLYLDWSKDYQIDGLVIDINSAELRQKLGREENMNPKYARAYKNPDWNDQVDAAIIGKVLNISKQGKLKGTVTIPPTIIGDVEVKEVTFYNAKFLTDFCLTEGRKITVKRSGDVIPKIVAVEGVNIPQKENFKSQKEFDTALYKSISKVESLINRNEYDELYDELSICPCCDELTKWDETFTELICINPECKDKKIAKLVHFFSTLKIEDFGEPSIRTFYENGYDTIEKILNMKQLSIVNIEGFGVKSSVKLLSQFGKLKTEGVTFAKLLHALDVFEGKIGEKTVQLIFDNVDWENITDVEKLIEVDGVAEITANVFARGIQNFWDSDLELRLPVGCSYIRTPKPKVIGDKLKGERICFTSCRPSKELEENIQNQGGSVVSGVSKKTTILVVKDMSEQTLSSNKATKAKQLGIKIVEMRKLEI